MDRLSLSLSLSPVISFQISQPHSPLCKSTLKGDAGGIACSPMGNRPDVSFIMSRSSLSCDQCLARPLLTHVHGGKVCVSLKSPFAGVVLQRSFGLWLLDSRKMTGPLVMFKCTRQSASIWTVTPYLLVELHISTGLEI